MNKKILLAMSIFLFLIALATLVFALGPAITIISPANNTMLPDSTTSVLVEINTNVSSICKYHTTDENFNYLISGTQFDLTGSTIHNMTWSVSSGNNYTFYYKCNSSSVVNDIASYHRFSVNSTPTTPIIEKICTDSDGGKNYYAKGDTNYLYYENSVLQTNSTSSDVCAGAIINGSFKPNVLREYFCTAQNTTDYEHYDCACSNGACPGADTTAPVISNARNSTYPTNNVNITWDTNENANSAVYYGFTTAYGSTATDANYLTSHSVLLTGLTTGGILYHYKVGSCDNAGNCANSSDYNFTTVTTGGAQAPPINITIKNPLNGSTITESLTWLNVTTTVNAVCKYELISCFSDGFMGTCGPIGYSTMGATNSTSHLQLITGLSNRVGNEWYEISVNCTDTLIDRSNISSIRFNVDIPVFCTDTDSKDYYTPGIAGLLQEHEDYCKSANSLIEYSCNENNTIKDEDYFIVMLANGSDVQLQYKYYDSTSKEAQIKNLEDLSSLTLSVASNGTFNLNLYGKTFYFRVLDTTVSDSDIQLTDGPMVLGEKVSCPYGCENGACKTCTWPSVGDWVIGENEVVECNNKNITLTSIEYEVTVSSLTGTEAVFIVNGETTSALGVGGKYILADGNNIVVYGIATSGYPETNNGYVDYCIELVSGGICPTSEEGETRTLSFGGNLYVDSNANFTLNNSILNADGIIGLWGSSNNILENSKIYSMAGFSDFSVNRIYNTEFNKSVWFDGNSINTIENSLFNNSEESIGYRWNSANTIKNSTFYGYSTFNEYTVNNIENSEFYSGMVFTDSSVNNIDSSLFCESLDFIVNSTNNISNSKFGLNCPKELFTYTDKETGEEVTGETDRWVSVQFSGNSNTNVSSSVFNNSGLGFRGGPDVGEPKVAIIDSTIYEGLSLSTQTNENITIENIRPGVVNAVISSDISQFELALINTQIGWANVYGEENSTTSIINSVLDYAYFSEGSTSLIKDSTINATYFDHNTSNTIENSSFEGLSIYENSVTSITNSTIALLSIMSGTNDLAITDLRPGTINTNIGSIIITNTAISNFIVLFAGNTINTILNSNILGLFTGDGYFTDYSGVSTATATTIENSDIGYFLTGGNAVNNIYNSTFNSTRYSNLIKEETGKEYNVFNGFSNSNNTIENSNFYGKIALVDNASFNFANSTVENIYWVGSEYKRCYSEGPIGLIEGEPEPVIEEICVPWEYLTIKGTLNITNKTISSFYGNTSLTRHYPIYIDAIGPANNKLVSIKDNGNLIWSGTTGSTGYAEAVLVFDNSTYNDVYNIVIDNVIIDNISLTKDTPIKYTIPVIYNLLNSSITDTSATISWNTNKLINSKLYYGLTKAYENSITNETLSASRSFDISGLLPNMLYQYKAESCDEVDYCAVSYGNFITSEPIDNTAPVISNIAVSSITTSSAAISWGTDEGATAQLEYGATTAYGKNTTFDARLLTSHSFNLTGLNYNTQYYYKISSYDGVGNLATAESSFTTLNDATAPVISNVQAKEIYEDGAYLYAETNEESWYDPDWAESNVLIDYGENDSYGRTSIAGEISHSEGVWRYGMIYHINYFEPNETYHYRFAAKDRAGNVAYSADYTFTTSYTEPPVNETAVCLYNGNCWINEQCYDSSATNPENYLQYCDSNKTQAAWSYKAPQFDSVTAWLGDTAGTQPIFYVIVDASQPVSIRGTATPIPGDTRTLFFSPLNTTTNMYSTNAVVGANRDVSYKLSITNAGGETAEFSGLVESTKPNLIVSQSDNRRGDNSKFKNQTVYIPDNKTVELPLNNTHNSRLLLKTDSEILKKAEVIDIFPINNPSAYAGLPADNKLDSFEINMTFDNSTTNLTYCVSYAGFSSIDEDSIKAYKLVGSSWNEISSTKDTAAKEICAVIKSAQTPYLFAGNPTSSSPSGRGGSSSGGGDGSPAATPAPATKPKPVPTPLVKEALSEEKTKEETISLFGEGKRPSLKERISKITGAVTGFDGPISSIGYIAMLSVIIVGLGAYTFYDRRRCY